jgi:hypothetical protein
MEIKPLPPAAKPMPPSPAESQRSSTNSIEPASPMVSGSRSVSGGSVAGDTPNSRAKPEALLPSPPPSDGTVQSSIVEALRVQVAQLQSRLRASEARVAMWEECMQHMCQSVMFSPDMNETYKDTCVSLLRDVSPPPHPIQLARAPRPPAAPSRARSRVLGATRALSRSRVQALSTVDQVTAVRFVDCSFPSVPSEAPHIQLERWESMQDSEWTLRWAPSWSVQVAFEGSHYITFSMIMRLFDFRMSGRMKVRMANDISSVSISFVQPPKLRLKTECSVSWGSVPLPLQTYIETVVQVR